MTNGTRKYRLLGGALALLGMVMVVLLTNSTSDDGRAGRPATAAFTISGDAVDGISPGKSAPIDLEFANPGGLPLTITEVRVRIINVSAPRSTTGRACSAGDYVLQQLPADARITIQARETGSLSSLGLPREDWPRLGLINHPVNQDNCKGASIKLGYTATGAGER